ncbi:MAG: lysostaphin resistance A-like protein, partial [Actinomycetes bacterium]
SWATAAAWTVGGLASGPLHLGWIEHRDRHLRRPVYVPVATGVGAFAVFYGGALVARRIPPLRKAVARVVRYADDIDESRLLATVCANAIAEEVFFRGGVYPSVSDRHAVVSSTALYALATVPTRNPVLIATAVAMGSTFALQRRASGGVQAPVLTHLTWSILMVRTIPRLLREDTLPQPSARRGA